MNPRVWIFRLTPLLDILLVLLFATLIQNSEYARLQTDLAETREKSVDKNLERVAELEQEVESLKGQLVAEKQANKQSEAASQQSAEELERIHNILRSIATPEFAQQMETALEVAGPEAAEDVRRTLESVSPSGEQIDMAKLVEELARLSSFKKICTFWELTVDSEGKFQLSEQDGQAASTFAARSSRDAFENGLLGALQDLDQPKDLLLLTLRYEGSVPFGTFELMGDPTGFDWIRDKIKGRYAKPSLSVLIVGPLRIEE